MHSADLDHMFGSSSAKFDDPFMLPSSQHMPEDLASSLDFCLFLYYLNPQYRRASSRVIRHFITDFEYPGEGSGSEKDTLDDYTRGITMEGCMKHPIHNHKTIQDEPLKIGKDLADVFTEL